MSDARRLNAVSDGRLAPYSAVGEEPEVAKPHMPSATPSASNLALEALSRAPLHRNEGAADVTAANARFRTTGVDDEELTTLAARFQNVRKASLRDLLADGFSPEDIARIADSEGGAEALVELHERKYLGALTVVGFSHDQIVHIAASGNGDRTIHHALQLYAAFAQIDQDAKVSTKRRAKRNAQENTAFGHERTVTAISNAVGTKALDRMVQVMESGDRGRLSIMGWVCWNDEHMANLDAILELEAATRGDVFSFWSEMLARRGL
ncbi:hypothetical protein LJR230_004382 [Trinickia sp. LjRoot230]|uniref:hypothetical protein n=1 Tax=Trinickia sp. LjRoot230 TaxID=3342288 RepID=UPI003ED13ACB